MQDHVAKIVEDRVARLGPSSAIDPSTPPNELRFDINAYICGLNDMITAVRDRLKTFGWHRKQIVVERYD